MTVRCGLERGARARALAVFVLLAVGCSPRGGDTRAAPALPAWRAVAMDEPDVASSVADASRAVALERPAELAETAVEPTGPVHPLLEALREVLRRDAPTADGYGVDTVNLAGTASARDRAIAYTVLDRAVRALLPVAADVAALDAWGARLRVARPVRNARGLLAAEEALAAVDRECARLEVPGACAAGACPDADDVRCLRGTIDAVARALAAMRAYERAASDGGVHDALPGDARSYEDVVRAVGEVAVRARECDFEAANPEVLAMLRGVAAAARGRRAPELGRDGGR